MANSKAAPSGSKAAKELNQAAEEKAGESDEGRIFPKSEANTAKDHAQTATEIAAAVAPAKGEAAASAQAASIDDASAKLDASEAKSAEDEDKSLFGRIQRSGLVFNRDNVSGEEWVGPSVQTEGPEFAHRKLKVSIFPLSTIGPRTGTLVRPDGLSGESFTVPDLGFGPSASPDEWAKVTRPDGSSLFG